MKTKRISLTLFCLVALQLQQAAGAWGRKGHEMTARVAVRALPEDTPAFLREADVEMGYLCPEPDRWRIQQREPALWGLANRDHILKLELIEHPLPENRYDFLLQYAGKPRPWGGSYAFDDIGFAPYAMAERAEMLTVNFLLWRQAPERTEAEKRVRRQIEQNIIHIAGLLCHFITDTAQPLHTTVHLDGWSPHTPNPKGYTPEGDQIHRRFETVYIEQSFEESDFEPLVGPVQSLGPWLEAAMDHIRESHQYVETVYAFDQRHRFGDGEESAEAREFTRSRLARSSQALRDFLYSAWVRSGELAGR
jgi:hypothetical protein